MGSESLIFTLFLLVIVFAVNLLYSLFNDMTFGEVILVTLFGWFLFVIGFLIILYGTMWGVR